MSITLSASKAAYLEAVAEGLADLPGEDRDEVIQDLEAHLAELDDQSVERILGTPAEFVQEFRTSAGLDESAERERINLVTRLRNGLAGVAQRTSEIVNWPRFRPVWLWVRGWVVVSAWAWLYDGYAQEYFALPSIGGSPLVGLLLVAGATWLSLWLARNEGHGLAALGSVTFSIVAGLSLVLMLANPIRTYDPYDYEEQVYFDSMMSADGNPITNIHAFDLEGQPVQVLLFDQDGRPLRTLPGYVYEEADYNPTQDTFESGYGTVTFQRDQYGRIIPNLYPLELSTYDEYGNLVPMPPPSLGFPGADEEEATGSPSVSTTTIGAAR